MSPPSAKPAAVVDNRGNGNGIEVVSGGTGINIVSTGDGIDISQAGSALGIFLTTQNGVAITTESDASEALFAISEDVTSPAVGIVGDENGSTTAPTTGVEGITSSPVGGAFGVYGVDLEGDQTGLDDNSIGAAVVGDTTVGLGVLGLSDQSQGVTGVSADSLNAGYPTAYFDNTQTNTMARVLYTYGYNVGGICIIDVSGNLGCSGTVGTTSEEVQVEGSARKVALNSIEAPETGLRTLAPRSFRRGRRSSTWN